MKVLHKYKNGNTDVTILEDGTKIREYEDIPIIKHPESIDIKISNFCTANCTFCHESSTIHGKHADLLDLQRILEVLPSGVEFAIGGGSPTDHPSLKPFLSWCYSKGFICNLTINQKHLSDSDHFELLTELIEKDLVKGIEISISDESNLEVVKAVMDLSPNVVLHLIAGVNNVSLMDTIIKMKNAKVLILGYKQFGRGIKYYSDTVKSNIKEWYQHLHEYLGKCVVSFDNLAIEQLEVKRLLSPKMWKQFYMGDDFTFTMYIDAVKQEYAPTSRDLNRVKFKDKTLLEYFKDKH